MKFYFRNKLTGNDITLEIGKYFDSVNARFLAVGAGCNTGEEFVFEDWFEMSRNESGQVYDTPIFYAEII